MHKYLSLALLPLICFAADEKNSDEKTKKTSEAVKISEAFGHIIAKNIETLGYEFDISALVKGLQDHQTGKNSPLTETECLQAISIAQEEFLQKQSKENLEKAQKFLEENRKKQDIISLEEGKIQYKILQSGNGTEVQEGFSPTITYTGSFLGGEIFGSSKEPEMISLEETIPGFTKGLLGMKEGEKRTIFIHPDLAYGTYGSLPPNSLLIFEVEVVKANAKVTNPSPTETLIPSDSAIR